MYGARGQNGAAPKSSRPDRESSKSPITDKPKSPVKEKLAGGLKLEQTVENGENEVMMRKPGDRRSLSKEKSPAKVVENTKKVISVEPSGTNNPFDEPDAMDVSSDAGVRESTSEK